MSFANTVLGGASTLIRRAIKSPNFATGVSGWTINKDGSAEFNSLTIRGTFDGTNFEINANGIFQYSGVPALGNLVGSDTNNAGTDSHGNAYVAGKTVYLNDGVNNFIALQMTTATPGGVPRGQIGIQTSASAGGPYSQAQVMQFTNSLLEISAQSVIVDNVLTAVGGTRANPTAISTDNFHYVGGVSSLGTTFGAAWQNTGGGFADLAFWFTPEGEVAISGTISTVLAAPNNNIFTLPANYIPNKSQRFGRTTAAVPATGCNIQVASGTGIVQVSNAPGGVATTIGIDIRIPLVL